MRHAFVCLLVTPLALAAPVPKELRPKPRLVELTLSEGKSLAADTATVIVTVRNNGTERLVVSHTGLVMDPFEVVFRDAEGQLIPYDIPADFSELGVRTVAVAPGESRPVPLCFCKAYFANREWPVGKFSAVLRLKHGDAVYESKPYPMGD